MQKLTVVGSVNVDLTAVTERLPEPGETIGGGRLRRDPAARARTRRPLPHDSAPRCEWSARSETMLTAHWMRSALAEAGVDTTHIASVGEPTGTALIVVDRDGENQIAVCEGANALVSIDGVDFSDDETVLAQLEISLELVTELAGSCIRLLGPQCRARARPPEGGARPRRPLHRQ